jgi:hypothetical protein
MHTIRSSKSYYVAAFVLGSLIALLVAAPARSAEMVDVARPISSAIAGIASR